MKIASWNVNGIRAILKKGNLQEFLAVEQPDIICLQEIKGEKSLIDIDFKDYFEYWNTAERKGYSGTAVFSKTEPLSVTYNFPKDFCKDSKLEDEFGHTNTEGRIITVEYKNFFLVTVYTPNVKRSLERLGLRHSEWDKLFLKYLKKLESKKPVIFCGDLNVAYTENDLARPKDNIGNAGFTNEERSGFGEYLKADFVDTWRMFVQGNGVYTWWSNLGGARSRNVGWRIDYIMISKSLQKLVSQAYIHDKVLGSDHCPVAIDINL